MIQLLQWCMKLRLWGFDKHTQQAVFSLLKLAEFGPLHKFIAVFAETLDFPFWPLWYAALYSVCCAGFFPLPSLCTVSCYSIKSCVCFSFHPASVPLLPLLVQRKGQGVCYENLFSSSSIGIVCQCDICQCQFYWTNIKCICKFCQCTVYLNWCHFASVSKIQILDQELHVHSHTVMEKLLCKA